MNASLKLIILYISLFSVLFLGSYKWGPLSIRNYVEIIGLFFLFFSSRTHKKEFSTELKCYILYIGVLVFSAIINGDILGQDFLRYLVGFHLFSIIVYLSVLRLINTSFLLKKVTNFLVLCVFINQVVSILQYYNNPIGWAIGKILSTDANALKSSIERFRIINSDVALGQSIVSGLCGFVVENGYFMASFGLIPLLLMYKRKRLSLNWFIYSFIAFLGIFCVFVIQQRMTFIIYLSFVFFFFLRKQTLAFRILCILLLSFLVSYFMDYIDGFSWGRLSSMNDKVRTANFDNFKEFIFLDNHFFWGGMSNYVQKAGISPHNTFLEAWLLSGFGGMLIISFIYVRIFTKCLYSGLKMDDSSPYAVAILGFLLCSLTHSTGIQSGSVLFWILYALMIKSIYLKKHLL